MRKVSELPVFSGNPDIDEVYILLTNSSALLDADKSCRIELSQFLAIKDKLDDLSNVDLSGLQTDQTLKYDGSNWVVTDFPAPPDGVTNLGELDDVNLSGIQNGYHLVYNGSNWVPTAPTPGITTLAGLTDVNLSGIQVGQHLEYNGVAWLPVTPSSGPTVKEYDLTAGNIFLHGRSGRRSDREGI